MSEHTIDRAGDKNNGFAPSGMLDNQRRDETADGAFYAIDPTGATEIDDAIRIVPQGNVFRVDVAIADGTQIDPESPDFSRALKMGQSMYGLEEGNRLMLESEVLQKMSLGGIGCRAVVLSRTYDYESRPQTGLNIYPAWVDVQNFEYGDASPQYIEMVRRSRPAINAIEGAVFEGGRRPRGFWKCSGLDSKLVAASMAWSNQEMATWFAENDIPMMLRVYRETEPFQAGSGDNTRIIHGHYSLRHKGHAAFPRGYTHFTSPLRRAADLVAHQQWGAVCATGQRRYSRNHIKKLARSITLLQTVATKESDIAC